MEKNERVVDFGNLDEESVKAVESSVERAKNGERILAMNDRQLDKLRSDGYESGIFWTGVAAISYPILTRYIIPMTGRALKKLFGKK